MKRKVNTNINWKTILFEGNMAYKIELAKREIAEIDVLIISSVLRMHALTFGELLSLFAKSVSSLGDLEQVPTYV